MQSDNITIQQVLLLDKKATESLSHEPQSQKLQCMQVVLELFWRGRVNSAQDRYLFTWEHFKCAWGETKINGM